MRMIQASVLAFSFCAVVAACGGDSGSSNAADGSTVGSGNGGSTPDGGVANTGTGGTVGTGTGGTLGSAGGTGGTCTVNLPPCLSVYTNCAPTGACMSSSNVGSLLSADGGVPTSFDIKQCYANGVKLSLSLSVATQAGTEVVTKNGAVCFTIDLPAGSASTTATLLTVKNPSGQVIATINDDGSGTTTVMCANDGKTYSFPSDCTPAVMTSSGMSASPTDDCPMGTCN